MNKIDRYKEFVEKDIKSNVTIHIVDGEILSVTLFNSFYINLYHFQSIFDFIDGKKKIYHGKLPNLIFDLRVKVMDRYGVDLPTADILIKKMLYAIY